MSRNQPTPGLTAEFSQMLAGFPAKIERLTAGLTDEALAAAPDPKAWSALRVLAHLRACSDLWSYSIYAMLAETSPELPLPDERRWAKVAGYAGTGFRRSLQAFTMDRERLVAVLAALSEADWSRDAHIRGRRHTVFSQCRRMALHEADHLAQVESIVAGAAADRDASK
ncbi:MAG: DinB family protein [Caldilineales bacterium]